MRQQYIFIEFQPCAGGYIKADAQKHPEHSKILRKRRYAQSAGSMQIQTSPHIFYVYSVIF